MAIEKQKLEEAPKGGKLAAITVDQLAVENELVSNEEDGTVRPPDTKAMILMAPALEVKVAAGTPDIRKNKRCDNRHRASLSARCARTWWMGSPGFLSTRMCR